MMVVSKGLKMPLLILFGFFFLVFLLFFLTPTSNVPDKTVGSKRLHQRAEMLWQQGQELYSQGKIRQALDKFKESFQLEPDQDKGSYIAWLVSEVEKLENNLSEEKEGGGK